MAKFHNGFCTKQHILHQAEPQPMKVSQGIYPSPLSYGFICNAIFFTFTHAQKST